MFNPTTEQLQILELFNKALKTRTSLVVQAGAGTGKTSTLKLLAESTTLKGQYIAFNKSIVTDSKTKFPANVECNTAHSLAWKAIIKNFNSPLNRRLQSSQRMASWECAKILGLTARDFGQTTLSANRLYSIAYRMVENFCKTADREISYRHCPWLEGLDDVDEDGKRSYVYTNQVGEYLLPYANQIWEDLQRPNGQFRFTHSHYLKMYQLTDPKIDAEFIMFDEAQDANPVMQAVIANQTHATLVWVGDSQQQIYSFTGAVNALQEIEQLPGTQVAFLTQSFRFGQAVADVANEILESLNAQLRLKGFDQIESTVEAHVSPDVYLTRTNAAAFDELFAASQRGLKVALMGDGKELLSFARAADGLQQGKKVEHPELACFETWDEVLEYVQTDDLGDELKLNVDLCERFGPKRIMAVILSAVKEKNADEADLIISTAHKAKGREWDVVQLGPDFPEKEKAGDEERRLLYVAVTRAKITLDITRVRYFGAPAYEEI